MSSLGFTHRRAARAAALCTAIAAASSARAQTASAALTQNKTLQALGLRIAASGSARDTLGLLVASVLRDGPADQAGITTGNRIVAVNGQPTRLVADEVGRRAASDSAVSRFVRAVHAAPSARDVLLKVSGGGAVRTIALPLEPGEDTVRLVAPASAAPSAPAPAQSSAPTNAVPVDSSTIRIDSSSVLGRWLRTADTLDARAATTGSTTAAPVAPAAAPSPVEKPVVVAPTTPPQRDSVTSVAPHAVGAVTRAPATIELARVSADLASYLGAQGDSALVVVRVAEWLEPLRAGDVILRVDGAGPDAARLHASLNVHARVSLLVARRGHMFSVVLGDEPAR